ncbi:MAG: YgiQ family radical SAM protein [Candidatus Omnitrophota bacterium]
MNNFLPTTPEEVRERNWDAVDVLLVSGDAYVDHPAFGAALIGRVLEAAGYRVAILAQPDWHSKEPFLAFGRPRLFVGITAGCLDSMMAHYTASGNRRKVDAYSPGGAIDLRPNRAAIVYANRVREAFPGIPIVLGGIEASLRRLAHYDYWSDQVRRSILLDSRADWIAYGMAEQAVIEIARRLAAGEPAATIHDLAGTLWITSNPSELPEGHLMLPSEEETIADKKVFTESFGLWYLNQNPTIPGSLQDFRSGRPIVQPSAKRFLVQMPPALPLTTAELDRIYSLPFARASHPIYKRMSGVPALASVETSITSHRGCGGGCAFCTLASHQGRIVQNRSLDSIQEEMKRISRMDNFRGTISDVGGPTANMYGASCRRPSGACNRNSCLYPKICSFFKFNGAKHLEALASGRKIRAVKHVFASTGIRHDLALADPCREYLPELCRHHVSGHLKVAPEHISRPVLEKMHKPDNETFQIFRDSFKKSARQAGKELYLVPYFMSGHPGCQVEHMRALREYVRGFGHFLEQVQDFTPLPMTLSGCMYWTGVDPLTGAEVYSAKGKEKTLQRMLLQPNDRRHPPTSPPPPGGRKKEKRGTTKKFARLEKLKTKYKAKRRVTGIKKK